MKKIAFFVEGLTEQIFIDRLIKAIAGSKQIQIIHRKGKKNTNRNRSFKIVKAHNPSANIDYVIIIYDCGGETNVKPDILRNKKSLEGENFEMIVGLRDVYPTFSFSDIPKLEGYLTLKIPTSGIPIRLLLAVMETEAWFLSEENHYSTIDKKINVQFILQALDIDVTAPDIEKRPDPSNDLNAIYRLAGKSYLRNGQKTEEKITRTIDALDFINLYCAVAKRMQRLQTLIDIIDGFFDCPSEMDGREVLTS